ncbi:MAG TPA: hypothetical protein PKW30_03430 [Campylobacterales bacterium]|nr:hypothetical protein [Campylobacterales bacterium]
MIFQDEFLKLNIIDNIPLGNISKSDIHGHGLFAKQVIQKIVRFANLMVK